MFLDLKEWLETVVSPDRVTLIEDAFEAMVLISDYSMDEIGFNLVGEIDRGDTYSTLNKLNSDLVRYPEELLAQYGVFLNIEVIQQEHLPILVEIMTAIRHLDVWDEPSELMTMIDTIDDREELFAEMCNLVVGCDVDAVLDVTLRIESSFIEAVTQETKRRLRVDAVLAGDSELPQHDRLLYRLLSLLPEENDIREVVEASGQDFMPWQTTGHFRDGLALRPVTKTLVLEWYCLGRLGGFTDPNKILQLTMLELELLRPDDLPYHSEFLKVARPIFGALSDVENSN